MSVDIWSSVASALGSVCGSAWVAWRVWRDSRREDELFERRAAMRRSTEAAAAQFADMRRRIERIGDPPAPPKPVEYEPDTRPLVAAPGGYRTPLRAPPQIEPRERPPPTSIPRGPGAWYSE